MTQPFLTVTGKPRLRRCAVLFLDLLGVREMSGSSEARKHLRAIEQAISGSYGDFLRADSPWPAAFFSDTLVLAAPILSKPEEHAAISGLLGQAARLQLELIGQGFFARGGLAIGQFHIHNGLIFGPALVGAYELESTHAVHPRVILDRDAERCQREGLDPAVPPEAQTQATLLHCDDDGWTFINYLGVLFDEPDDPRPRLVAHRDILINRLAAHSGRRRLWEKYRWAAEYHNSIVSSELKREAGLLVPADLMTWQFRRFEL